MDHEEVEYHEAMGKGEERTNYDIKECRKEEKIRAGDDEIDGLNKEEDGIINE